MKGDLVLERKDQARGPATNEEFWAIKQALDEAGVKVEFRRYPGDDPTAKAGDAEIVIYSKSKNLSAKIVVGSSSDIYFKIASGEQVDVAEIVTILYRSGWMIRYYNTLTIEFDTDDLLNRGGFNYNLRRYDMLTKDLYHKLFILFSVDQFREMMRRIVVECVIPEIGKLYAYELTFPEDENPVMLTTLDGVPVKHDTIILPKTVKVNMGAMIRIARDIAYGES